MVSIIRKVKGSMMMTAVAVIVIFSLLIAFSARMLTNSTQNTVTVSVGSQAELLAHTGTEYAMALLFPLGSENGSLSSSLWGGGEPASRSILPDNCNSVSHASGNVLCNGFRDGCFLDKLYIDVKKIISDEVSGSDVLYEYRITSSAVCSVPFIDTYCEPGSDICSGNTGYYQVRRSEITKSSDISWNISAE
jgi:hypothetical protein